MSIRPDVYSKVISAKLYIDKNFHEPIDLSRLSRQACISRFHFHRLFTRIYRKTPHQYLTQKRIGQAIELLTGKNLTISEICSSVGFESIGSFSVLFKKNIGFTPRDYRSRTWLRKQQAKIQPRCFIPHCYIETLKLDQ